MEDEILEAERQRNEIIKRIQEKERLLNLIQSRHAKGRLQEIKEFYRPISYERGVELRKMLIERLKQWKVPEADYEEIVNKYFQEYKNFCFNFPLTEKIREDNFFVYYQSLDLLNYMESINPETALNECNQFKQFMLDKNKEFATKLVLDEMERQYKYKSDVYQYNTIDEFEENNLLDEIDNRYNFEPRSSILNRKK